MQRGLLTGIIMGLAMTIFALQNTAMVPVKFLWVKLSEVPLALIPVISIMIGVLVTAIFAYIDKQRLRHKIRRLHIKVKELDDQLTGADKKNEAGELNSEEGISIEGEPGHRFFD